MTPEPHHYPLLPGGMTRNEAIEGLRVTLRMAEDAHRRENPGFVQWPDATAMIDYIEANGFPPPDATSAAAGPELADVARYADGASKCYYCGSMEHDDTPCPKRANDAERYAASGRSKYPTSRPHNAPKSSRKLDQKGGSNV